MRSRKFRKPMALCLTVLALLGMCLGVFAEEPEALPAPGSECSLTIYKYDLTGAQRDGAWEPSSYVSTGIHDDAVHAALDGKAGEEDTGYAVEGVAFTIRKIADFVPLERNGTVLEAYPFAADDPLLKILEVQPEDAVLQTDTQLLLTSDRLEQKLREHLDTSAIALRNALEAQMQDTGTELPLTDRHGKTGAEHLDQGLYLVVETKVPEQVTATVDPFFVRLPMMLPGGDSGEWNYDVTVYPKNRTAQPTLEKQVRVEGEEGSDYAHVQTASGGDLLSYRIRSQIPEVTSNATRFTQYTFLDSMESGLSYTKGDVTICWYAADGETELPESWAEDDGTFAVTYDDAEGMHRMRIALTQEGLEKLNAEHSGHTMCITYTAVLEPGSGLTCGEDTMDNSVLLQWARTSEAYLSFLQSCCHISTYGLDVRKEFSDGRGDMTKVRFLLQNASDGTYITAQGNDGIYAVTGSTDSAQTAAVLQPSEDGRILVRGLEADRYLLTEQATADGYMLLPGPVRLEISERIGQRACILCGTALPEASGTIGTGDAELTEDNGAAYALLPVTIVNHRGFTLPKTGDNGVWMYGVVGIGIMAVSGAVLLLLGKKKQRKEK